VIETKRYHRILWIGTALSLLIGLLFSHHPKFQFNNTASPLPRDITNLPPQNDTPREGDPKIEWFLFKLMNTYRNEGLDAAQKYARDHGLEVFENTVRVFVETESAGLTHMQIQTRVRLLKSQIETLGGGIETSHQAFIQSRIPLSSLKSLADSPEVRFIRPPVHAHMDVISEGVSRTGADTWHSLTPFHPSKTVSVAILDYGFQGYQSLLGTELPESVTTRAFRADENFEGDSVHGTACGEIVYDMAPDVEMYLVHPDTLLDFQNAVDWLINKNVDVISHSASWLNINPGDGTGLVCNEVQKAVQNGIVWVNSAGNYGQRHWSGLFNDPDSDGWHNFSGEDEIFAFNTLADVAGTILLNWNDWGVWDGINYSGSDQDFDLYLYFSDGANYYSINQSGNTQNGTQWPVESISNFSSSTDRLWGMAIKKISATKNVRFDALLLSCQNLEYSVPAGSLGSPADSPYAVAVGATDWFNDAFHPYSSQGPTLDGRIKPDICAPSGVSTSSYGSALLAEKQTSLFVHPASFYGTSASCPHTAGAAALLLSKTPYDAVQVLQILMDRAVDYGPPGKDNKYGYGRLNLRR
jgi:hypothetical protein